jgi:polyisoprenoid-binding protein YceI
MYLVLDLFLTFKKNKMKNIKFISGIAAILGAFIFIQAINKQNKPVEDDYIVKVQCCGAEGATFKGLKTKIWFDETHPEKSKISATLDATSFNTGNYEMNAHAKEINALNTEKYPVITFVSTAVKRTGATNAYEATGNLTLKGLTNEIKFPFTFDSKKDYTDKFPFQFKETFQGRMTINPKDFNITRQGVMSPLVIDLTVPITKASYAN